VRGSAVRTARRRAGPSAGAHRQPSAAPPPNPGAQATGARACSRYALAAPREPGIWPCTVRKGGPLSDIRRRWVAPWSWSRPEPGRAAALRSAPGEQTAAPARRVAAPWISFGLRTAGQAGTAEIWPPPSQHHPEQEYSRGGGLGLPLPHGHHPTHVALGACAGTKSGHCGAASDAHQECPCVARPCAPRGLHPSRPLRSCSSR
jgi:hypothetical protein